MKKKIDINKVKIQLLSGDISDEVFKKFSSDSTLSLDIETSGLDWRSDSVETIQIFSKKFNQSVIVKVHKNTSPQNIISLIESPNIKKLFHHAMFDLRFIVNNWGVRVNNIGCTKVASKILFPGESNDFYSLKSLLNRFFQLEINKKMQMSDWSGSLSREQIDYATRDVIYLPMLYTYLYEVCLKYNFKEQVDMSMNYLPFRVLTDLRECGDVFTY